MEVKCQRGAENLHSAEFSPVDLDDGNGKVNHEWTDCTSLQTDTSVWGLQRETSKDEHHPMLAYRS